MKDQIKSYLQRLNHGEALENVQADFVRECKDVDPAEIMHAEQELLREGTSIEELQRLCDVHSALFHGSATDAQKLHAKDIQDQRLSAAAALIQISGHPLQTFTLENAALEKLIARAKQVLENGTINDGSLNELRQIAIHYAKKGDLLYPHLKVQYGISGPSAVMWTVDDEIRDEISFLAKMNDKEPEWQERFATVVSTGTGDDLQRGKYFVSELCGEFHGGRVDRHLPRPEGLCGLFRRGAGDLAEGRGQSICAGDVAHRDGNPHAGRASDDCAADRTSEYDSDGDHICGCGQYQSFLQ